MIHKERDFNCPRSCEAPVHDPGCPCVRCINPNPNCRKTTDDHFTPRSILKIQKRKDSRDNHQWLSVVDHRLKDADTPLRGEVLRLERSGVILTFAQHRKIFERGRLKP
jgi:hypothetical protein